MAFEAIAEGFVVLFGFTTEGAAFVFGNLAKSAGTEGSMGFFFAFQVLPTIIFFSCIMSVLYYLGIMHPSEKPGLPMELRTALTLYGKAGTVFVDARKSDAFQKAHIEGARHIPYSFVEPLSKQTLDSLRDSKSVVVYCNREDSEASKLLAGELVQAGINGVAYLEKGFAGWVKAGGRYTGRAPEAYDE